MAALSGYGLVIDVPRGWEAEIYRREPTPVEAATAHEGLLANSAAVAAEQRALHYPPVLHLATFPLPPTRGDFGGGALSDIDPTDVFIAIFDYGAEAAAQAMFDHDIPWPLGPEDFDPHALRVGRAGQSGCQRFFRAAGRGYCLYVVLGSHALRRVTAGTVNAVLAGVRFE